MILGKSVPSSRFDLILFHSHMFRYVEVFIFKASLLNLLDVLLLLLAGSCSMRAYIF